MSEGEFRTIVEETSSIQASDAGETGYRSGWDLGSLHLPAHLYGHDLTPYRLRRDSYALEPPLQRNPGMLTEKSTFPLPFRRRRKGVSQWTILFACVRVGHRYMENQYLPHVVVIVFPRVRPEVRVLSCS